MAVLTILSVACLGAIGFNRCCSVKAREEAIAIDFLVHYTEMVKGLAFEDIRAGAALNPLLDGTDGAPNIRLPASAAYFAVDSDNYETFHPELTWLASRNPQLSVTLTSEPSAASPRLKRISLRFRWDPPLGRGQTQSAQLDVIRVRDL